MTLRILGIAVVFIGASIAWLILGGSMGSRTTSVGERLEGAVNDLWGTSQTQQPPDMTFHWTTEREEVRNETSNGKVVRIKNTIKEEHQQTMGIDATAIDVDLKSKLTRKGLMWYSLYDATFAGDWTYTHHAAESGTLAVTFALPAAYGLYDDFHFSIDGVEYGSSLKPIDGRVGLSVPVKPGQQIALHVSYATRGADYWNYAPNQGVLTNFKLTMHTDFADIDFPGGGLSPSAKERNGNGWNLEWAFSQVITGRSIGMVTPTRLQPGELAAEMSFSAPVSLLFFFVIIFMLATLRKIDIHPFNYLLLAAAFFAFHLLFAYTVDRMSVEAAFALASCVSVALVVSYLRLVVGARFAFIEAAAAQLVYLVGFSLAHFWVGYTGLSITVMAILTLFLVMQLTGRIRFSGQPKSALQMPVPSPIPHA